MEDLTVNIKLGNLDELIELLNNIKSQAEQLEKSLTKLSEFGFNISIN